MALHAGHVAAGAPSTGTGALPVEHARTPALQLLAVCDPARDGFALNPPLREPPARRQLGAAALRNAPPLPPALASLGAAAATPSFAGHWAATMAVREHARLARGAGRWRRAVEVVQRAVEEARRHQRKAAAPATPGAGKKKVVRK